MQCFAVASVPPVEGGRTFAVPSSEPLTSRGGPLLKGQHVLTKLSCSAIFFTCSPVAASHARTCGRHTAPLRHVPHN